MESFLRYWLAWPVVEQFMRTYGWAWSLAETLHFIGLIFLIGAVGLFDLRVLGMAKSVPIGPLRGLLPWGVFGFVLCVITGTMFLTGLRANLRDVHPYDLLATNIYLQLKFLFILLAGLNLLAFYVSGMSRAVGRLGAKDDAPLPAKLIAGTSLFLWLGVIYFGRLLPWGMTN